MKIAALNDRLLARSLNNFSTISNFFVTYRLGIELRLKTDTVTNLCKIYFLLYSFGFVCDYYYSF